MHLSMLSRGGGGGGVEGRANGGDLINEFVPWVGNLTSTFFLVARWWGFFTG